MDSIYAMIDFICQNSKMSQEEIDLLYTSLGISSKSLHQQFIEAKKELESIATDIYVCRVEDDALYDKFSIQKEKVDSLSAIERLFSSMQSRDSKARVYPSLESRNKVFLGNINLAKKLALRYFYKCDKKHSFDDLFQIACLALLSASYYYVPCGGAKFSTYATKCIDNKLKSELFPKRKTSFAGGIDFLSAEKERMRYLKMFLDGGLSLQKLNRSVIAFNKDAFNSGEDGMFLPRTLRGVCRKQGYEVRYEEIVQNFIEVIRESSLNSLISDSDRQFVARLASYKNIGKDKLRTWTLQQYVNLYMQKLISIIWYLEIEQDLVRANAGRIPTNVEILKKLNEKVRDYNCKVREWGKNPYLESRFLFSDAYSMEFDIDVTCKREQRLSDEIDSIICDKGDLFNEWCDYLSRNYQNFLMELEGSDSFYSDEDLITCHFTRQNVEGKEISYVDFYVDSLEGNNTKRMSVLSFKQFLREQIDYFSDRLMMDFIENELNNRKKIASERASLENISRFQKNRAILEYKELHSLWWSHKRLYTEEDVDTIQRDIEILYSKDDSLIPSGQGVDHGETPSLEDTVIGNLFLEDYYREVSKLDSMQRDILLQWFDVNGMHFTSAKDIAEKLGITPNKVYKEKAKALKKLANSSVLKSYRDA